MKIKLILLGFLAALISGAHAQGDLAPAKRVPDVGFAIIKTSKVAVVERLLKPDGRFFTEINTNFSAFLIKHHDDYLLFDTGLAARLTNSINRIWPCGNGRFSSTTSRLPQPDSNSTRRATRPSNR